VIPIMVGLMDPMEQTNATTYSETSKSQIVDWDMAEVVVEFAVQITTIVTQSAMTQLVATITVAVEVVTTGKGCAISKKYEIQE